MRPFKFRRAYGRQVHVHPSIFLSIVKLVFWAIVGRLRSQKTKEESQPPVRAKVGATLVVIEVRINYYERRSR
jgi:hypothetical protein